MTPERILSIILAAGFLAAPLIALLYGPQTGLVVLAGALLATIALARTAHDDLEPARQTLLDRWVIVNAVLLVAALIALVLVSV
jgi:hypothetical protein